MADKLPVKARFAPGSPIDVVALQEFEPTDTIALSLISGFAAGVTSELANNSISTLSDVDTSGSPAPANGEVLAWNSISGMWEPTLSPGSSAAIWGNITGTLSNQLDLQAALNLKADQSSLDAHTGDGTIHFTEASIDHTAIANIGTNSHAQIDNHIADATIHFSTLDGLNDVVYTGSPSPSNGQVLTWNGTGNYWEPSTISDSSTVKISATDTTSGYLANEMVAGSGITLNVQNPSADEKLQVVADVYLTTVGGNTMAVFLDASRANKELSVETANYLWAESAIGNNDWLQIQHASDANSGYIMPFNGTIVSIQMHCENTNNNTKDINLYIGNTNQGSIGQFTGSSEQIYTNTALDINVSVGDKIRLRGAPGQGTINDTNVQLRIKWRV